jgi:hypothetical protein
VYERFLLKIFNSLFSPSHIADLAYYIFKVSISALKATER